MSTQTRTSVYIHGTRTEAMRFACCEATLTEMGCEHDKGLPSAASLTTWFPIAPKEFDQRDLCSLYCLKASFGSYEPGKDPGPCPNERFHKLGRLLLGPCSYQRSCEGLYRLDGL